MSMQLDADGFAEEPLAFDHLMGKRWSVAEIDAMVAKGALSEDAQFELIDGEIVPMQSKGGRHESVKRALIRYWGKTSPDDLDFLVETTLRLSADTFLEPDVLFCRSLTATVDIGSATTLLAVEIADSSLRYDLGRRAAVYARLGVQELWVIDAWKLVTTVHRTPQPTGYLQIDNVPANERLVPEFAPALAVVLSSLRLV